MKAGPLPRRSSQDSTRLANRRDRLGEDAALISAPPVLQEPSRRSLKGRGKNESSSNATEHPAPIGDCTEMPYLMGPLPTMRTRRTYLPEPYDQGCLRAVGGRGPVLGAPTCPEVEVPDQIPTRAIIAAVKCECMVGQATYPQPHLVSLDGPGIGVV